MYVKAKAFCGTVKPLEGVKILAFNLYQKFDNAPIYYLCKSLIFDKKKDKCKIILKNRSLKK